MADEERFSMAAAHKKCAVHCFNLVWRLLDEQNRSRDEDDNMMHAAHASRYHWGEIGTSREKERGEWQLSRVYSVLNRPQPALHHSRRCLDICTENNIGDFDIAFAHEAVARASACAGNKSDFEKHFQLAEEAGEKIKRNDEKKHFFTELESGNWYDMK